MTPLTRPLLKRLAVAAVVITAPVSIPLLFVGFLTEAVFLPQEFRFKWRMRSKGRWISQRELLVRIERSPGTLIIDSPTISWGITRVWWTSEDLTSLAPMAPMTEDEFETCVRSKTFHPFDRWCWEQYLDEEHGRALLIGVWHSDRMAKAIIQRYTSVRLAYCWSGSRVFETFANHDDRSHDVR